VVVNFLSVPTAIPQWSVIEPGRWVRIRRAPPCGHRKAADDRLL